MNSLKIPKSEPLFYVSAVTAILAVILFIEVVDKKGETPKYGTFSFSKELKLPGHPTEIYDAITGDLSAWWDHTFSKKPAKFYLDPKPGGGFYEIFDQEGNGVLHATVIYADRGKMLRFDGPLGLSGRAIHMVFTYTFKSIQPDSTLLTLSVHAAGETGDFQPVVEKVWDHFLFERFKPYVESGAYKKE